MLLLALWAMATASWLCIFTFGTLFFLTVLSNDTLDACKLVCLTGAQVELE